MGKKNIMKLVLAICGVFLTAGMLSTLTMAEETQYYNMYIEPYIISLNANSNSNGNPETMVSFGCYLSGERITDSYVEFVIDENIVVTSTDIRVTRMGVCQAYFDKAEIQNYAIQNGLGGEVNVTLSGYYTHEPISGGATSNSIEFTGDGVVFFR